MTTAARQLQTHWILATWLHDKAEKWQTTEKAVYDNRLIYYCKNFAALLEIQMHSVKKTFMTERKDY